jgi:hypothetical protein
MSSTNNEPTIDQIKQSLDIVTVAEMYGELVKNGANYKFKNDSSIVINPAKQIFSDFNGSILGGSVLDLVMCMEKKDLKAGIERLKELSSLDTYTVDPALQIKRKEEADSKKIIDFQKLGYIGTLELKAVGSKKPIETHFEKENYSILSIINTSVQKLFETDSFPIEYKRKIDYLFSNIVGWNDFFKCPSIILKDDTNRIVDIIAYRPSKPDNYDKWDNPKYIYKNSHNRGESFLYPFKKEVESILIKADKSDRYLIVGEGIKNGLNALVYSVPFIALESSSNKISDELISYIRDYHEKGYNIISMFDGDKAGATAHENFKTQSGLHVENFLDFNSGIDFVDYLQSGDNK